MGTKIEKWLADDGVEFDHEADMVGYELDSNRLAEVDRWLSRDPYLTEAARTSRRRAVMSFLHWQGLEDSGDEPEEDA